MMTKNTKTTKTNMKTENTALAEELRLAQESLIKTLDTAKNENSLLIRVKDAPNSVWQKPFEGHVYDLKNEEYKIQST